MYITTPAQLLDLINLHSTLSNDNTNHIIRYGKMLHPWLTWDDGLHGSDFESWIGDRYSGTGGRKIILRN
jgi:hypothetical protein